ncbi:MAG: S9 family peptidase [Symbiobacteriaceae bacterium]|nr:S9 family peptidase [Symbiobacteriaceae bacterium]
MSNPQRPITIEDLYQLKWISDPQISPDGKKVLYVQKVVDPEDKTKYLNQIWMVDLLQGEPRAFTSGTRSDTSPRWSPCGTQVAFISSRSGNNQIWLIPATGGEAKQLTKFKRPLGGITWSPDGKQLLATARIGPEDEAPAGAPKSDVKVITRLHYKMNGEGYHGDRRGHIFLVNAENGEVKQLTNGDYDQGNPTWAKCGTKFIFTGKRFEDADYSSHNEIYEYTLESGEIKILTDGSGSWSSPSYSGDGQRIACFGHQGEFRGATLSKLWILPAGGGKPTQILSNFDQAVSSGIGADMVSGALPKPLWSKDDQWLYFVTAKGGSTHLYRVASNGGEPEILSPAQQVIYGLSYHKGSDTFIMAITSPDNIGDLHSFYLSGDKGKRLTACNQTWFNEVWVSLPEHYSFTASNDVNVEGWMLKPYGFDPVASPNQKVPLVLQIHGGPHSSYGMAYHFEMQMLCAKGFAVIFSNPQGSSGYGQKFVAATHHDWGGQDYRDVMQAVDEALAKWSFLDGDKMGLTGGSYGGYMTNWVIGQTNRFKAAVTARSTSNRFSMFGTSDVGYNNGEYEFDGKPWINYQHYLEHSPIMYVENITTPLKIIHSELDYRCPIEQGEQFYTALKWLKKTVVFVRFPNESHELSRSGQPKHRVERLEHIAGWFEEYLK